METLKKHEFDYIRIRLPENLLSLYDETMAIYIKNKAKPEFLTDSLVNGRIKSLTFINIPEKVIQGIYNYVDEAKANLKGDYKFIYDIGLEKKDNKYTFTLGKT